MRCADAFACAHARRRRQGPVVDLHAVFAQRRRNGRKLPRRDGDQRTQPGVLGGFVLDVQRRHAQTRIRRAMQRTTRAGKMRVRNLRRDPRDCTPCVPAPEQIGNQCDAHLRIKPVGDGIRTVFGGTPAQDEMHLMPCFGLRIGKLHRMAFAACEATGQD